MLARIATGTSTWVKTEKSLSWVQRGKMRWTEVQTEYTKVQMKSRKGVEVRGLRQETRTGQVQVGSKGIPMESHTRHVQDRKLLGEDWRLHCEKGRAWKSYQDWLKVQFHMFRVWKGMKCGCVKFTTFSDVPRSESGKRRVHLFKNFGVLAVYLRPHLVYFRERGRGSRGCWKAGKCPGFERASKKWACGDSYH